MNQSRIKHVFPICVFLFHVAVFVLVYKYQSNLILDYFSVWLLGAIFSSIELGSRYKDDPWSVISSSPGACYMLTNALICCFGLFIIITFGLSLEIDESLPEVAQRTSDILCASLGSFFIMRSSFLKLGNENTQFDLGLNLVLKKLLEMIDRQVDRVRASRRSNDITRILKQVSYDDVQSKLKTYCLQVMQNVPPDETEKLFVELKKIEASDDCEETKKLSAGLQIYNIVGKSVLEAAVTNLELEKKAPQENTDSNREEVFKQRSTKFAKVLLDKYINDLSGKPEPADSNEKQSN